MATAKPVEGDEPRKATASRGGNVPIRTVPAEPKQYEEKGIGWAQCVKCQMLPRIDGKYLGMSPAQIGVVLGLAAFASLLAYPAWGLIADTFLGRERTLVLTATLYRFAPIIALAPLWERVRVLWSRPAPPT